MARFRYAPTFSISASVNATGPSLSGTLSWGTQVTDQDVVEQLFNELEEYRILYEDVALEDVQECRNASGRARGVIGELLRTPRLGKAVKADLQTVRGYFTQFASDVREQEKVAQSSQLSNDQLGPLLHTLRQSAGQHLGLMASRYDVGVGEKLTRVIPDQTEWFHRIWQ